MFLQKSGSDRQRNGSYSVANERISFAVRLIESILHYQYIQKSDAIRFLTKKGFTQNEIKKVLQIMAGVCIYGVHSAPLHLIKILLWLPPCNTFRCGFASSTNRYSPPLWVYTPHTDNVAFITKIMPVCMLYGVCMCRSGFTDRI